MHRRAWRFLPILVLLAAAGCAAPEAPPAAPSPAAPLEAFASEVAWDGCDGIEAIAFVDPAKARPHVPEAFDLLLRNDRAGVVFGGMSCGEGGRVAERAFVAIQVTPRDDALRAPTETNYFWLPEHLLVPDADVSRAFAEARANATPATSVAVAIAPAGGSVEAEAADGLRRATTLAGAAPTAPEAAAAFGHFREYVAADGGFAYVDARFAGASGTSVGAAPAEVTAPPGSVASELFAGETPVALQLARFSYAEAQVGFVPWP